jgi:hypothetical protein
MPLSLVPPYEHSAEGKRVVIMEYPVYPPFRRRMTPQRVHMPTIAEVDKDHKTTLATIEAAIRAERVHCMALHTFNLMRLEQMFRSKKTMPGRLEYSQRRERELKDTIAANTSAMRKLQDERKCLDAEMLKVSNGILKMTDPTLRRDSAREEQRLRRQNKARLDNMSRLSEGEHAARCNKMYEARRADVERGDGLNTLKKAARAILSRPRSSLTAAGRATSAAQRDAAKLKREVAAEVHLLARRRKKEQQQQQINAQKSASNWDFLLSSRRRDDDEEVD